MEKAQIFLFFVSGFLVSRLLIKAHVPTRLVGYVLGRESSFSRVLFFLTVSAAGLSLFIPNALTVITLLPVVAALQKATDADSRAVQRRTGTMMALAMIYGANIGGMGSITATPANGILVGYLLVEPVANADQVGFASWLVWGIPLVLILTLIAWIVLSLAFRPWQIKSKQDLTGALQQPEHPMQAHAVWASIFFLATSIVLSLWMHGSEAHTLVFAVSAGMTLVFVGMLFIWRQGGERLLTIPDCYSNLPVRGIGLVAVFVLITGLLALAGIQNKLPDLLDGVISESWPTPALLFSGALLTTFGTELLSNTVVQIALFTVTNPLAEAYGFPALLMLLTITLSCTCAFMSPMATGVNGLAFGEIRHVSLPKMLMTGAVMNVLGALVIVSWVWFVVGRLYG